MYFISTEESCTEENRQKSNQSWLVMWNCTDGEGETQLISAEGMKLCRPQGLTTLKERLVQKK